VESNHAFEPLFKDSNVAIYHFKGAIQSRTSLRSGL